ncbi:CRISPR-associated endonuclease/helicase Cas3 [Deinococcus sp. HSC-46F16]|uniref:CRISPR-associated helicase Cas3' n=1 Tax=Deinococcus sp. HSC-46F16 TaxID=2910968 RepID=UPI00209EC8C7|nr:CRISPR-associated helicase Cas3' [Deinococcus sp. HSC-46F16]MCP2014463.1 CRISPR-associated endonuclease/helicase Cas3 [Deinococcus sp. HSC-46F16]
MTQLHPITAAARTLWAKSAKKNADGTQGAWLPVLNHLLDVAACAAEILSLEPPQTRALSEGDLGLEGEQALAWTLALVALHDLGKASPAFQVLWAEGKNGVDPALRFPADLREPYAPHGVVSQVVLPDFLTGLGWPGPVARRVADAVGCHHGFRVEERELNLAQAQTGDARWGQVRKELCRLVTQGTGARYDALPTAPTLTPAAFMRLAGLTSFADWLGSSFPLPSVTDFSAYEDPAAYFARARERARQTLAGIRWPVFAPLREELPPFPEVFGFQPRPLQTALAQALADVSGPALVLVEAPMGEGKTEAAFYAHIQLQHAAGHRGMYVALPTQATGNAMYERFAEFLAAQGRETPPDLQLAHGGTLLSEKFQATVQRTRNAERDPAEDHGYGIRAEEWFTNRKRALLSEYGVGTVDQALLGVLGVSHQFVRLWGLGNRVVVLDEVHAYDTYTSELIAALVAWLRALGSSVIIMSATLPESGRRALLRAWGVEDAPTAAYPRLTVAPAQGEAQTVTIPDHDEDGNASRPPQHVTLRPLGSAAEEVARQAVDLAVGGGCVAVIVNTVARAQAVQARVLAELGTRGVTARTCTKGGGKDPRAVSVLLYHARYPADERLQREKRVRKFLGKQPYREEEDGQKVEGSFRPERFILIATQVAEQSLDFDADVMLTDLAPADLVLQRAGRLHRHAANAGKRHGHDDAVLYVAGLDEWPDASMEREFWGRVYAPALLYRSWLSLRRRLEAGLTLPDDLDELVQEVYAPSFAAPELTPEQREQLAAAEADLENRRGNEATTGMFAHIGRPADFWQTPLHRRPDADPDSESLSDDPAAVGAGEEPERPRTRLGEEGVRVVPVERAENGAWRVCRSPFWDRGQGDIAPLFDRLGKADTAHAIQIYRRSLGVSRWELVRFSLTKWDGQGQSLGNEHRGWRAHPLLRDAVPLVFTGGVAEVQGLQVRLDPEQGLVYVKG